MADSLRKNRVRYDELASGQLVGEYDQSGNLIQEIVWLDDIPVATIRTDQGGTGVGVFYIHTDHLNAPTKITRPSDNVAIWRWDHDPYGNGVPNEDPDGNGLTLSMNQRYPGQYYDAETGLYSNGFRDCYDPTTGRYCQPDPIGLEGGLNPYAYVGGNPVSYIDPEGLAATGATIGGNIGAAVGSRFGSAGSRIGRLVGATVGSAIEDMCTDNDDDDFCYKRWEQEDARCSAWYRLGARVVQACKTRAADRRNLCVANSGKPDPNEPPEYSPFRDYPR